MSVDLHQRWAATPPRHLGRERSRRLAPLARLGTSIGFAPAAIAIRHDYECGARKIGTTLQSLFRARSQKRGKAPITSRPDLWLIGFVAANAIHVSLKMAAIAADRRLDASSTNHAVAARRAFA